MATRFPGLPHFVGYILVGFCCIAVVCWRPAAPSDACDNACAALGRATKHAREDRAVAVAATSRAETLYVTKRLAARTALDTLRITDTVQVREVITKQADALVAADTLLVHVQREREAANREVRALGDQIASLQPKRLSATASALYDPIAHIPAASAEGALRLTASFSLIARADQRFAPGERPRLYVGGKVTL